MGLEQLDKTLINAVWKRLSIRVKTAREDDNTALLEDINEFRNEIKGFNKLGIGRYLTEEVSSRTLGRAIPGNDEKPKAENILENLLYLYAYYEGDLEAVFAKIQESREQRKGERIAREAEETQKKAELQAKQEKEIEDAAKLEDDRIAKE